MKVVSKETCQANMGAAINDGMLCAGDVEGDGSCQVKTNTKSQLARSTQTSNKKILKK